MVGHQYLSNVCIKTKPSNQRKGKYVKPFTSNPKPNFGQESCPLRKLKLFLKKNILEQKIYKCNDTDYTQSYDV